MSKSANGAHAIATTTPRMRNSLGKGALELLRHERRGLVGRIGNIAQVRDDAAALSADVVVGEADVDGLRAVTGIERRNLAVRQSLSVAALRVSEQCNGGNVIGDLRGQLMAGQVGHT